MAVFVHFGRNTTRVQLSLGGLLSWLMTKVYGWRAASPCEMCRRKLNECLRRHSDPWALNRDLIAFELVMTALYSHGEPTQATVR